MARILIVEDNKDLNQVYKLILERAGHTVESVYNGAEALSSLQARTPDIILLDLIMPRKSGVDFLQEAQLGEHYPTVKVLVFTNLDHSDSMNQALAEGAHRCAIKARTTPQGLVRLVNQIAASSLEQPSTSAGRARMSRALRFRELFVHRQRHFE